MNPLFVIVPLVVVQYLWAMYCLILLAYMGFGARKYILWNVLIMVLVLVGGLVFVLLYGQQARALRRAQKLAGPTSPLLEATPEPQPESNDA